MGRLIDEEAAIDAMRREYNTDDSDYPTDYQLGLSAGMRIIEGLPSAQHTLYGYNIEHLKLIADVLRKENLPPERVAEALNDIGRIVEIVSAEFAETLRKAVEQCKSNLIDRQAAIEIIQSMYPGMPRVPWMRKDWQKRYEPYIRTENAIRKLPSAQPTQTDTSNTLKALDCVERRAAIDAHKHRFDKSPTAACYCKDCAHYGGKTFGDQCYIHDGWRVADNWFCWDAEPRKHDPEEEETEND